MSSNAVAIEQAAAAATPAAPRAVKSGRFGVAERIMAVTVAGFVCTVVAMFAVGWRSKICSPAPSPACSRRRPSAQSSSR